MFQKRLDRLYTAASWGPSNPSVVSEGPCWVAFSSRRGAQSLPLGPRFSTWHAGDKKGHEESADTRVHLDRTGKSNTHGARLHHPVSQADMIRAVPESHFDLFSLYEKKIILSLV